jgi:hypothetical protein
MKLHSHLKLLRSKPEHVRRRIAFWSSFGVTAVIFMFWLASFSAIGPTASGSVAKALDEVNTPAQSMVAAVGSLGGTLRDRIFGPKKVEFSTVEVMPGER